MGRKRIRKAAGHHEEFNVEKLSRSLLHCGASPEVADSVARTVYESVEEHTTSSKVFHRARRELAKIHPPAALRYNLKRALFRLGPTGYPFEQYFSRILREYGYVTRTNLLIQGRCVEHEVDVVAENGREVAVIECKYHNRSGRHTDVKVALYVHARMEDLREPVLRRHSQDRYVGWLVTNTRLTSMAVEYGRCVGLRMTGWKFPEGRGLEKMIEEKGLYPMTVLSGLKRRSSSMLMESGIVLLRDLLEIGEDELTKRYGLGRRQAAAIMAAVDELCGDAQPPNLDGSKR